MASLVRLVSHVRESAGWDNEEVGVLEGNCPRDRDFTAYVRARRGSLARFARFISGDPELSEDLVQEALVKAYLHWDRISGLDAPDAYVRRIILNDHISWCRSQWRRCEVTNSEWVETAAAPAAELPLRDSDLWAHVVELAPMQRAAVVLHFCEDLSEAQVAACLACSTNTVKTHLRRALKRLNRALVDAPA